MALSIENKSPIPSKRQYSAKSLLRYPGGKTRAVKSIIQCFPGKPAALLSPFLGGGSVELALAAGGTTVYGYDTFPPLVEFWQCVLKQPNALANEVEKYFPLSKSAFYELQQYQTTFHTRLERAAVYYVLNRSSFSGSTLSGGMSPGHPRFTHSAIERLRRFYNPNIIVKKADYRLSLKAHPEMLAYLDPPYLIKSLLYGKKGNTHKDFDHEELALSLRNRERWVLSYNDCPAIRHLYKGFRMITPNWKYGMGNDKTSKEILIFSHDMNIPVSMRANNKSR